MENYGLFISEYPTLDVATIGMGDGSVLISSFEQHTDGNVLAGISFSKNLTEDRTINKTHQIADEPLSQTSFDDRYFQLLFDNPDSIRSVMAVCEQALETLENTGE
jgi:hypothetical protein